MDIKSLIEVMLALTMFVAAFGVVFDRMIMGRKGVGLRIVQFLLITFVVPAVGIAFLQNKITGEPLAAILGAMVGSLSLLKCKEAEPAGTLN
jgi:hypothetical protein